VSSVKEQEKWLNTLALFAKGKAFKVLMKNKKFRYRKVLIMAKI
jgi:hypothetical protein